MIDHNRDRRAAPVQCSASRPFIGMVGRSRHGGMVDFHGVLRHVIEGVAYPSHA